MQLHVLVFKMVCTFVCKKFSSCRQKIPRKNCRQIYGKSKAGVWRNLSTVMAPKFVSNILCCVALFYNSIVFFRTAVLRKLFDIRISYKLYNFLSGCLLVKMASKTVTSSILPHSRGRMFSRGWFVHRLGQNWNRHQSSLRKHSQPTFRNIAINFPTKLRLRNERWNSILMTRHYPDLGSASDWSCAREICFKQSEALPRTEYASSVWNLCARFLDVFTRENH